MLRETCVIGLLLTALSLMSGCGASNEIEVGAEDSGGQVELRKGQVLAVTLESNPTTGYGWEVAEIDEAVLRQWGEAEFESSGSEGVVGAGGQETLRFEAVGAGQTTLRLAYRRSWEEDVEPEETFSVQVTVR